MRGCRGTGVWPCFPWKLTPLRGLGGLRRGHDIWAGSSGAEGNCRYGHSRRMEHRAWHSQFPGPCDHDLGLETLALPVMFPSAVREPHSRPPVLPFEESLTPQTPGSDMSSKELSYFQELLYSIHPRWLSARILGS